MFKTKEELRASSARKFVVRKKIVWSYVEKVLLVSPSMTRKNGFVHPIGERSWIVSVLPSIIMVQIHRIGII